MEKNGLGKRINAVRKDRGLTSDKLSEMCNINATYLLQDELGENEISAIREIEKLWKEGSPGKQSLVLDMIRAVLTHSEQ